MLITRPNLGAEALDAFLALVRRSPGRITFASWGIGSTSHLAMEALIKQARLEMLHVPFTGAAPASTALVAGQVDVMFLNAGPAEATARDGRAKIIAVGAPSRIPLLPNTPTLAELGMPIEAANRFGLLGPAGTPATLAERIAEVAAGGAEAAAGAGGLPRPGLPARRRHAGGDARLRRRRPGALGRGRGRPQHPAGVAGMGGTPAGP